VRQTDRCISFDKLQVLCRNGAQTAANQTVTHQTKADWLVQMKKPTVAIKV